MNRRIILKRGRDESLRRYHPWVFSGAIARMDNGIDEGDTVDVLTAEGNFIARGHYQNGSIAVRVLTFDDEPINDDFWRQSLLSALTMREKTGSFDADGDNDTYRLVNGEGDNLPGLIIDIYGRTAVIQAHSVGMHRERMTISRALMTVMKQRVDNIFYKSETTLPYNSQSGQQNEFIVGGSDDDIATENGLRFHVDWLKGQKTGFFIDQRENRQLLGRYARGRRVLNMFCYTGGFSLYAMRGGARTVSSVDSSQRAIDLTMSNMELNFPGDDRHRAFCGDAFQFLNDSESGAYDLIILDPPAFAKHHDALHNALKGYIRLNAKTLEKIDRQSILFTFSCSQVVTKDHFRNAVLTAALRARRRVRIIYQLHQPADHPVNIYHPEGEYLKGLVLYVE